MRPIYIVDDLISDRLIAQAIIERMGLYFESFSNGYDLLDKINGEEEAPQLIIVDLTMPKISGLEVLKKLKLIEKIKGCPVLIMSARNQIKDVKLAIEFGASDYIVKPIDRQIFEDKVLSHIGNNKSNWEEFNLVDNSEFAGADLYQSIRVTSLNEVGMTCTIKYPMQLDQTVSISSRIFGDTENTVVCRVIESKQVGDSYLVKFRFAGATESNRKSIRLTCRKIWVENGTQKKLGGEL